MSTTAQDSSQDCYISASTINGQPAGRGLFSSRDVGAGRAIATVKRPLMASLEAERLRDTCANCYVWTEGAEFGSRLYVKENTAVQMCAGCKRFRYCSRTCQKKAWTRGHKHECKNLQPVADRELPKAVLGCMDILVRRKHGLIPDATWNLLCALPSHVADFKRNGNYGGIELMALGTAQFSATADTFPKEFVAEMYARLLANSMTLVTPTLDPLGIVVDAVLCVANHSCDPNAYIVMDGPQMQLRSLKPIAKDEEIYISYIDATMPFAQRQTELQDRWFFTCACSKCRVDSTSQHEPAFAIPVNDLPSELQELADTLVAKDPNLVSTLSTPNAARASALQQHALNLHSSAASQPAAEAIATLITALDICERSKLFAPHDQPRPALVDDLIPHLLAAGRYAEAWRHCVRRWRDVHPVLYPSARHPVRVVQVWQMGMLALFLASEGGGTTIDGVKGVDREEMGVVAGYLIRSVAGDVEGSHGAESTFAESVMGKWGEVEGELERRFGGGDAVGAALERAEEILKGMVG